MTTKTKRTIAILLLIFSLCINIFLTILYLFVAVVTFGFLFDEDREFWAATEVVYLLNVFTFIGSVVYLVKERLKQKRKRIYIGKRIYMVKTEPEQKKKK